MFNYLLNWEYVSKLEFLQSVSSLMRWKVLSVSLPLFWLERDSLLSQCSEDAVMTLASSQSGSQSCCLGPRRPSCGIPHVSGSHRKTKSRSGSLDLWLRPDQRRGCAVRHTEGLITELGLFIWSGVEQAWERKPRAKKTKKNTKPKDWMQESPFA